MVQASEKMRITLIGEIWWKRALRIAYISWAVLPFRSGWRFLSTSFLIMPAFFVRAMRWSYFSSLRADTSMFVLGSAASKSSLMRHSRTESKVGFSFPVMAKSQLCCWSRPIV